MEVILKTADIRRICANGDMAYRLFSKYCLTGEMPEVKKLPSTSPANAAWNLERLTQCWAQELLLREKEGKRRCETYEKERDDMAGDAR